MKFKLTQAFCLLTLFLGVLSITSLIVSGVMNKPASSLKFDYKIFDITNNYYNHYESSGVSRRIYLLFRALQSAVEHTEVSFSW